MNVSDEYRENLIPTFEPSLDNPLEDEKKIKVASVFKRVVCSPLFWMTVATLATLTAATLTIVAAAVPPLGIPVIAIGIIAGAVFATFIGVSGVAIAKRKQLIYEVSLAYSVINNKIKPKKWPVCNEITDGLVLGRLPLKNRDDHRTMIDQQGIGAVLSLVEHFENHNLGVLSDPVTPKNWVKLGIDHMQIETPDFSPLSVEDIAKGVNFIEEEIRQGKKVYVHCKAGRSRSAAIVVAYLIKSNQFETVDEAIEHVRGKRSVISLGHKKIDSINAYVESIQS